MTARTVEANVRRAARELLATSEAQARRATGRMKRIGAVDALESGRARFLA